VNNGIELSENIKDYIDTTEEEVVENTIRLLVLFKEELFEYRSRLKNENLKSISNKKIRHITEMVSRLNKYLGKGCNK